MHLFALKMFLGVSLRTPNDLVYNELNRYPIKINFAVNRIRYWFKILQMPDDRLPKKAYLMLYNLDSRGKMTWATQIKSCLYNYGFGFVWMEQGVGRVNQFLHVLKQRMIDCRWQDWHDHVHDSERFDMYRMFCNPISALPRYLEMDFDKHLKYLMTKFRFGISDLAVHRYRYRGHVAQDLICKLCNEAVENQ